MVSKEHLQNQIAKIEQFFNSPNDEKELDSQLRTLIEIKEVSELNQHQIPNQVTEKELYEKSYDFLYQILTQRPLNGRLLDVRHQLRFTSITIVFLFQTQIYDDDQNQDRILDLIKLCFEIFANDSEEIAEIAVKILSSWFNIGNQNRLQFYQLKTEVEAFCKDFLEFIAKIPELAEKYRTVQELEQSVEMLPQKLRSKPPAIDTTQKNFAAYGCRSLKLGVRLIHLLLRQTCSQTDRSRVIDNMKDILFVIFDCLPDDLNNSNQSQKLQPKLIPFFVRGLEAMIILFHAVSLLVINSGDYLKIRISSVIIFFFKLANNLPGYATDLRQKLLQGFYTFYQQIFKGIGEQDQQNIPQQRLEIAQSTRHVLTHYLDKLLDDKIFIGTGQISISILHESSSIVYKLFSQLILTKQISNYHIVKANQLMQQCLLNPHATIVLKSQIIFCLYKINQQLFTSMAKVIEGPKRGNSPGSSIQTIDLQIEILNTIAVYCKQLKEQTAQGVEMFNKQSQLFDEDGNILPEEETIQDVFCLKEKDIQDVYSKGFLVSWKNICYTIEQQKLLQQPGQQEILSTITSKKEHYPRTVKNLFLFAESVLKFIQELKKPNLATTNNISNQQPQILSLQVMQLVQKIFINSCHLVQLLSELIPNDETRIKEVWKSFYNFLQSMPVSQFKDLLNASGDEFFGLIIEANVKGKEGGICQMAKQMMSFTKQDQQQIFKTEVADDFVAVFLEMFFYYIKQKINLFEGNCEDLKYGMTKQDIALSKLPQTQVLEVLYKKLHRIGEQTLHKANDIRVKHTFFAVFMFCVQQIRSGYIVPKYFVIIRNLFKDICNIDEQSNCIKEIMRDFMPMFQGLLATFLQLKDEVPYARDINEICILVPAKLKNLLDFLPSIVKPLVDSMEGPEPDMIQSGLHTIQYWLSALATYPELLDPVIADVQPQLMKTLKNLLTYMPNLSLKLMGKLGAKTRQYDLVQETKARNYPEDGLKIKLTDRSSGQYVDFGIDAVIDVLLVKILHQNQYSPKEQLHAVEFIKAAFLTYTDPNLDLDYITACIIQAKSKQNDLSGIRAPSLQLNFNATQEQDSISFMVRGSESHVFEKILRSLIIGCVHMPELGEHANESINLLKWVTKYFTLIYICKNGLLQNSHQPDEINPLLFVEYVCEFLFIEDLRGSDLKIHIKNNKEYLRGSCMAIKTMLKLLNGIYADQPDAVDNLEIIPILIQKLCIQSKDLNRNLAVNIAVEIIIKYLPLRALKKNCLSLLRALFQILQESSESVYKSVTEEIKPNINNLLHSIGVFEFKLQNVVQMEDRHIFNCVVDYILQNVVSLTLANRQTAVFFIEKIAKSNKITVLQLLKAPHATQRTAEGQVMSWADHIFENEIEKKIKDMFEIFKGGYSQVQQLMQFIDLMQFILKHGDSTKIMEKLHVIFGVAEYLLILLEDEDEMFERIIEPIQQSNQLGPNNTIQRLAKRYMKLERLYLTQNKEYDPYSHTMQTHQFLNTNFFEISTQAKEQKQKSELERLNQKPCSLEMKIFEKTNPKSCPFDKLTDEATRVLQGRVDVEGTRRHVRSKIEDFTNKIFGAQNRDNIPPTTSQPNLSQQNQRQSNVLRVQDISYDYMHDLYEMYPNVRLHVQLDCKILDLLSDIVSHPQIASHIKPRQSEFFETYPQGPSQFQEEEIVRQGPQHTLLTKFDYFLIEIKSKITCIYFKFFQRDERILQKKSQQCLKRLIKQETVPNEALPNFILKECVRPILNSITYNKTQPTYFQAMGKLIKVLNTCFNEALSKHLVQNYEKLVENHIKEPYSTLNVNDQPASRQEEVQNLIEQYNSKVQQIESACGIINCLHHLCTSKCQNLPEIYEIMIKSLEFETFLIEEFHKKFDTQLEKILGNEIFPPENVRILGRDINHETREPFDQEFHLRRLRQSAYDRISPLSIKLGHLRSDFRQGVVKFFNQSSQDIYRSQNKPQMFTVLQQMLNLRENYSLRERLSREQNRDRGLNVKQIIQDFRTKNIFLDGNKLNDHYVAAINFVYIFSKYNPQYLLQQRNTNILDGLREKWINKVSSESFSTYELRKIYMKIQKSLVIYCKNDNCDIQILFDLLKNHDGFTSLQLDMRPLIILCTKEIPDKASDFKKSKILEAALNKIQSSQSRLEAKYSMFEFAFMPIALKCVQSQELFNQFFNQRLITRFIETFFQKNQNQEWFWQQIYHELESRQKLSYQSFFVEIIKVLTMILRFTKFSYFLQCCPGRDFMPVINFLDWVLKHTQGQFITDYTLKEYTFYCLSCIGLRMMGLVPAGCQLQGEVEQLEAESANVNLLNHFSQNVLAPFFEYDLTKTVSKFLIQNIFQNLIKIFEDPQVQRIAQQDNYQRFSVWPHFKRRFSLEPRKHHRMALSTLIARQFSIIRIDERENRSVYRRLFKTVEQYFKQHQSSNDILQESKEPLMIIETLFDNRRNVGVTNQEVLQDVHLLFQITVRLYEYQLFTGTFQTNKSKDQFRIFAENCFRLLQSMYVIFPQQDKYIQMIDYSTQQQSQTQLVDFKLQLKSIMKLNLCALGIKHGFDFVRSVKQFVEFLRDTYSSRITPNQPAYTNWRLTMFPVQLASQIIDKIKQLPEQLSSELKDVMRKAIKFDVQKSKDRDYNFIQGYLVNQFLDQKKFTQSATIGITSAAIAQNIQNNKSDEMRYVQKIIPHFSIRLISELEQLRDKQQISADEFQYLVDNNIYKDIICVIYRVISCFRNVTLSEKLLDQQQEAKTMEDFCEFKVDDPNFDNWIKVTIMTSLKSTAIHLKTHMHQDEAFIIFEQLKNILKCFQGFKLCQYLIDQYFEITRILVVDLPNQKVKLIATKKAAQLLMLLQLQRFQELAEAKNNRDILVEKSINLCIDFLKQQSSLLTNDASLKIFDKLILLKPCCSYKVQKRIHALFEQFQGCQIKCKIQYMFSKISADDASPEQLKAFSQTNIFLTFFMHNFNYDLSLFQIKQSSRLVKLHSKACRFVGQQALQSHECYAGITNSLEKFVIDFRSYKNWTLENIISPMSDILRINPEHSHDKNIAEKIFSKIFYQIWQKMLDRQDQLNFAVNFQKMFQNLIKWDSSLTPTIRTQFVKSMFEAASVLKNPQIRIEPEVLQYIGKNFQSWHTAMTQLEDQVCTWPQNERIVFALHELYSQLMEEDLSAGLSRVSTQSQEMRSLFSLGQHHMWEQINCEFKNYINFYAEQEGLFNHLEIIQQMPGKYSRQLPKNAIINKIAGQELSTQRQITSYDQIFQEVFESDAAQKMATQRFPKEGTNRLINQIDLRMWESLFVKSLKILKKDQLLADISEQIGGGEEIKMHEMKIEYYWQTKNMANLKPLLQAILQPPPQMGNKMTFYKSENSIEKVRYHLYQNYILNTQDERDSRGFDENFKEITKLVVNHWNNVLPNYMDRVQSEYLILFQLIIESNEGSRNMISVQEMKKLQDYKCAMNIWRERLPNICESISTWQDVLENRNYIFTKLKDNILKQQLGPVEDAKLSIGAQEEPVDICWNNLKLAQVSRKHGYYGLAKQYLDLCKRVLLDPETKGEILKLERFKYRYESFKLQQLTQSFDSSKQLELINDSMKFLESQDYDLWMHAEIMRLQGEYFLSRGDVNNAKARLILSIEKNKKESKTWLAYARLNETEYAERKDERSIQSAIKGYFCAVSLSQHKSRLIIPSLLRLVKDKKHQASKQINKFVNYNIAEMPTWLWIFWIPQILQMLKFTANTTVTHETAKTIYSKLSRLYPQPSFYPMRAIAFYQSKKDLFVQNQSLQQLYNALLIYLKKKNPKLFDGIEQLILEFSRAFKQNSEENFLCQSNILDILNFSNLLIQPQKNEVLLQYYEFIYKKFLLPGQLTSPQMILLSEQFHKHLINPETRTKEIVQQLRIIKNIKDYLIQQKNLKEQNLHLEDIFPQLTNLLCKGIELPDQYITSCSEPLPEKIITISYIQQGVHRTGVNDKRIQFRCNNSKSYAYTISNFKKQEQDYLQFLSDERVTQLKIVTNMILTKHKESMRRGLKFHITPKILLTGSKLQQEDLSFVDLQEAHDYLLQEQNVDPEQALKIQLNLVQNIFDNIPESQPRELSLLTPAQVSEINTQTYQEMRDNVPDHLLTQYFHRIFYHVENLYVFKKQFTKFFAVNSLFSYAFNQGDFQSLNKLQFCKASGKNYFSETRLVKALTNEQAFKRQTFEEIEQEQFKNKDSNYMPFRLTPNFENFIGKIALHGLYAGVMTSVSLAISSEEFKFKTLLKLIFADEIQQNQNGPEINEQDDLVNQNSEFIIFKIKSLSQHKQAILQPPKSEEMKMNGLKTQMQGITQDPATGNIVLGESNPLHVPKEFFDLEMTRPVILEEFNKKVFALIEMAQDDGLRSQRAINWCAWF